MGDDSRRLFVGQLPVDILESEVDTVFRTYGEVTDVKVIDGKPPGSSKCAFVVYETEQAAKTAIQVLNDIYKFRHDSENPVRVSVAKSRNRGDGGRDRDHNQHRDDWNHRRDDRSGDWQSGGGGGKSWQAGQEEDDRKVFVGQLPMDIREDEIRQIFSTYGGVSDVKIIDGKPVGTQMCAFVCYETKQGAQAAVQVLNDVYKFRVDAPKAIRVEFVNNSSENQKGRNDAGGGGSRENRDWNSGREWSNDRSGGGGDWGNKKSDVPDELKCFVGNLPMDIVDEEVKMIFGTYGKVTEVRIIDGKPPGSNKCAFVHYETEQGAKAAIQVLNNVYKFRHDSEHPIRVEATKKSQEGGQSRDDRSSGNDGWRDWNSGGGRGGGGSWDNQDHGGDPPEGEEKKLFVGQLPLDITKEELTNLFKIYGDVCSTHIIDGKPPHSNKVAFVEYDTKESARAAIEALHDVHKFRLDSENAITCRIAKAKTKGGGKGDRWNDWGKNDRWNNNSWGNNNGWGRNDRNDRYKSNDSWNNNDWNSNNRGYDDRRGRDREEDRPVGPKLHIGNLPTDISREALEQVFGTYGSLSDVHIMNNSGGGQCAAFVTYNEQVDAKKAVAAMETGYEIRPGQGNINVTFAKVKSGQGGYRSRPY